MSRPPEPSVSIARAPSPPVIHPAAPPITESISLEDPDDKKPLKTEVEMYPGSGTFVKPQGGYKGPPPSVDTGEYTLNFENTDLQEVVKAVLGDLLKENYFIDPKVAGTITIQTTRPLKRHELLPTLENLLRLNGASLLQAEGMYKILPSPQAARGSPPSSVSRLAAARGYTIRVVPLRYIAARELHKLIEPFLPQDTPQIIDAQRNLLILTGSEQEIQAAVELVELFDVDWLSGMSMALFKLQYAEVKTLHAELEKIFGDKDSPLTGVVRMVPVERLNALLVVSSRPGYLDQARNWVERLDQVGESVSPRLYVYRVQNGKAADLAAVLGGIFGAEAQPSGAGAPPPEFAPGETQSTIESGAEPPTPGGGLSKSTRSKTKGTERGGVSVIATETLRIIADEVNNALLIMAKAQDYKMIEAALKRLDVIPLQVLIEASVIEVTLTDNLRYGLEWRFRHDTPGNSSATALLDLAGGGDATNPLGLLAPPNFSYALMGTNAGIRAVLNTLADESKLNVLSSPSLMVLDNQTATIEVVNQVPIITQQQQATAAGGVSTANLLQAVEFKDAGVVLEVTPRVNVGGRITMELLQDVTDVDRTTAQVAGNPAFLKRNIQTTVTVQSGETIVMGGLIRENKTNSNIGIPFIKDIPVLGSLFAVTTDNSMRTELIVLLTPTAVRDQAEARAVTEEFRHRLRALETQIPGG